MPRRTQYELAKRNYHSVKYFPFPIESGAPFMLTSNPWNFLNTWLNNEIRKIQRTTDKSKRLEKSFIPKKSGWNISKHQFSLKNINNKIYIHVF